KKIMGLPTVGSEGAPGTLFAEKTPGGGMSGGTAPTEEMQKLMAELEKLDRDGAALPPDRQTASIDQRAELLLKLADATADADLRGQWYRQLIDMLGAAVQGNEYPKGLERMEQLRKKLVDSRADEELISHVEFQKMWGE